jgi:hypothetical protein
MQPPSRVQPDVVYPFLDNSGTNRGTASDKDGNSWRATASSQWAPARKRDVVIQTAESRNRPYRREHPLAQGF